LLDEGDRVDWGWLYVDGRHVYAACDAFDELEEDGVTAPHLTREFG
jgi:hypothetical protein